LGIAIDFVGRHQEPDLLRFVLWDSDALETYEMVFSELAPTEGVGSGNTIQTLPGQLYPVLPS